MRQDSDGDCAHTFLEEPCRQQQQRRQQQEQRQQQQGGSGGGGGGPAPSVSPEGRPAAKQQRGAVLQDSSRRTKLVGPTDVIVDGGNVFVVPHDPR